LLNLILTKINEPFVMKNQVQLITYVDRLGGPDLAALTTLLDGPLQGLFGGVHLLPFYYPIDGADAGFDPIDHTQVDPKLGQWAHVRQLSDKVDIMADVIVNHMSAESPQFKDYLSLGKNSQYDGLFLTMDSVFPNGATEKDLLSIFRPRPSMPFTQMQLANGEKKLFWTTFTAKQIDIAVDHPKGKAYLVSILDQLASNGVNMIRLDACGYAIKKPGSNCFMLPETFDFIKQFSALARARGIEVLVEIHSYYQKQIDIARQVDRVYDFALPPLILHSFEAKNARALTGWLNIRPNNAVTVLDTHDGIGIIDAGAEADNRQAAPGLISDTQLAQLVDSIHRNSGGQSAKATGAAASNLDLYQVNCTFYDAMARNDVNYVLARAIQFFTPGIPQVYYVGLLAGQNDMQLLAKSGVGRDINRQYFSREQIHQAIETPVVKALFDLIRFRNQHPAFNGQFSFESESSAVLSMRWSSANHWARLRVAFSAPELSELSYSSDGQTHKIDLGQQKVAAA
jgi:sucrose phosphorylase